MAVRGEESGAAVEISVDVEDRTSALFSYSYNEKQYQVNPYIVCDIFCFVFTLYKPNYSYNQPLLIYGLLGFLIACTKHVYTSFKKDIKHRHVKTQ